MKGLGRGVAVQAPCGCLLVLAFGRGHALAAFADLAGAESCVLGLAGSCKGCRSALAGIVFTVGGVVDFGGKVAVEGMALARGQDAWSMGRGLCHGSRLGDRSWLDMRYCRSRFCIGRGLCHGGRFHVRSRLGDRGRLDIRRCRTRFCVGRRLLDAVAMHGLFCAGEIGAVGSCGCERDHDQ